MLFYLSNSFPIIFFEVFNFAITAPRNSETITNDLSGHFYSVVIEEAMDVRVRKAVFEKLDVVNQSVNNK
jgi:hypothetical protein